MISLEVVTPLGMIVDDRADDVVIPGSEGQFGVLPDHVPFMASIRAGIMSYTINNTCHFIAVDKGYAQVGHDNRVIVLTDRAATAKEVRSEQVKQSIAELDHSSSDNWDQLAWLQACLELATTS